MVWQKVLLGTVFVGNPACMSVNSWGPNRSIRARRVDFAKAVRKDNEADQTKKWAGTAVADQPERRVMRPQIC